jgi:TolB-like protein/tetratricopeptide (TPR) repeat protein
LLYSFENYVLDSDRRELRRGDALVSVEPQVFDVLEHLIRNRERVVSRDDLLAAVWNGRIVSDATLSSRINAVRGALGDSGEEQRLIRTVLRKGFRFLASVREEQRSTAAATLGRTSDAEPDIDAERDEKHVKTAISEPSPALALPDKPSIAVLPFQNMSGDPEQDYFADGISEDLITALSKIRWFFVISRNSTWIYKGKMNELKRVARELGVRYVLEGSVRKAGNRVRITAQLIDGVSGQHVWADRYDRDLADIFAVQDEITERVVAAVEPQLYAAEGIRTKRKPPESLDAWECVVRALSLMNSRAKPDVAAARESLEKAIALDPGYAQAHGLLSFVTTLSVHLGWTPPHKGALAHAFDAAHKALLLDSGDPWAHLALGYALVWSRQAGDAIAEYENALALNPNFAIAHYLLALALCFLGRSDEALRHADTAARLSPRDLLARGNAGVYNNVRATACFVSGRYREGIDFARKALYESPGLITAHRVLVINCALAGQIGEAKAALEALKRIQPDISLKWIREWLPYVRPEEAERYVKAFRLAGLE